MTTENKFPLGRVVATPGAMILSEEIETPLQNFIHRHWRGDWGDLCEADVEENEFSLKNNQRLLSSYDTARGKLWIITEWDRSATTCLLPSEY